MLNILVVAEETGEAQELGLDLEQRGYACVFTSGNDEEEMGFEQKPPDLAIVAGSSYARIAQISGRIKQELNLPVIALVTRDMLVSVDGSASISDFVVKPCDMKELELRLKRLLLKSAGPARGELITCGDLAIDLARCEVFVAGRRVALTFKEYELLKFLVSNRGRVFTREALLNKVWGYDYYGGDRTVDVHIRRLRSKLEDSQHTFIETVRNIGYKFSDIAPGAA